MADQLVDAGAAARHPGHHRGAGLFALTFKVIGDAQMTLFATFGGFATLIFANFGGTRRDKLTAHLGLAVAAAWP